MLSLITDGLENRPISNYYRHYYWLFECLLDLLFWIRWVEYLKTNRVMVFEIDYLDPNKDIVSHRLYRESCLEAHDGIFVKDLRIINRSL